MRGGVRRWANLGARVGDVLGGVNGLALWAASHSAGTDSAGTDARSDDLYDEFVPYMRGQILDQLLELLGKREPLEVSYVDFGPARSERSLKDFQRQPSSLERAIDAARSSWQSLFKDFQRQRSSLERAIDAARVGGGAPLLLVAGEPGYGKTVAVLYIALHLAKQRDIGMPDCCRWHRRSLPRYGMPVVFNLGSWGHEDNDLNAWMKRILCDPTALFSVEDEVASKWIKQGRIAPILDGLDEITDDGLRRKCVKAINAFIERRDIGQVAVVVASRSAEYRAINEPQVIADEPPGTVEEPDETGADDSGRMDEGAGCLVANAAIELQLLQPSRVAKRLREVAAGNPDIDGLVGLVENEPRHPVAETLRVPLWLWMAGELDARRAKELEGVASAEEAEAVLADGFIDLKVENLAVKVGLGIETCRRYLAAIASFLARPESRDKTEFRFEDLTPKKLSRSLSTGVGLVVGLSAVFALGLVVGLVVGPLYGLAAGLFLAVGYRILVVLGLDELNINVRPTRSKLQWPGMTGEKGVAAAFRSALSRWWRHGMIFGSIFGVILGASMGLVYGLSSGLVVGLIAWIVFTFSLSVFGLLPAVGVAICMGFAALFSRDAVVAEKIDEGRRASKRSLVRWGIVFFPVVGMAFGGTSEISGV